MAKLLSMRLPNLKQLLESRVSLSVSSLTGVAIMPCSISLWFHYQVVFLGSNVVQLFAATASACSLSNY
jgi:hypothetical protein